MDDPINWLIDLEISLVQAFSWSLREIDETAIETLIPFMARFGRKERRGGQGTVSSGKKDRLLFADEVDWL